MQFFSIFQSGEQPLVAAAIHDGHDVRPEVAEYLALDRSTRRREEDPFTAKWTEIADTRLIVLRSRFEVDLNRPRERAVYRTPDEAWGLQPWKKPLPETIIERSLAQYDAFYQELGCLCQSLKQRFGRFVVFDLHTYNHCRDGQNAPISVSFLNPEINLGTGTLDRQYWAPVIDGWLTQMRQFNFCGRRLDVRENVKFTGGHFPAWIHQHFSDSACVLSIEVKKFFMNEWTHELNFTQLDMVHQALRATVPGVLEALSSQS